MAAKKDYYDLLGVNKTASKDDLKKAYRKLAVQYHPDKNAGDKEAERKFKEINEAYDVLKDDQKRAAYDQYGHSAFQAGGHGGGAGGGNPFGAGFGGGRGGFEGFSTGNFSDIFEDFFGGGFDTGGRGGKSGARVKARGADLRYNMTISLEEAFSGKSKKISFVAATKCSTCDGTGSKDRQVVQCTTCNGSGRLRAQQGFFTVERTCHSCNGEGQIIKNPCGSCKGSGSVRKEKTLSVSIPAGVEDGNRIRLAGEGEPGFKGGPAGDLYIFMTVTPHSIFTREGADLHCKVPIKMTTAALGGDIEVPSIEGVRVKLHIPDGTQSEDKFRLKNKGMSKIRSDSRGDMYVHIHVETPIKLSKKQIEILQEFDKENNNEKSNPETSSFFKKVKDLFGG